MKHYLYLAIDIATIIIPFFFSFHSRIRFHEKFKAFFPAMILSSCIYLSWDVYFTSQEIWGFNRDYLVSIYIWRLPIEELLFFICIPFACVFSHYTLIAVFPDWGFSRSTTNLITIILVVVLVLMMIFYHDKLYTFVNAFFTLSIILFTLVLKPRLLSRFYMAWALLLIPFFMVNGVLTGSFIDAPIVWYNNTQNLGTRMFTIPIEDVFYGMGLILLNILLTEVFLPKGLQAKINYS